MFFSVCFRTSSWVSSSVTANPDEWTKKLSLAQFLSPDVKSVSYQTYVTEANDIIQREFLDGGDNDKKTKSEVYLGGRLESVEDVRKALCNLFVFLQAHVPSFAKSELWKCLSAIEQTVHTPDGKRWGQQYPQSPQCAVPMNLLFACADIARVHMDLGNSPTYLDAALTDKELPETIFAATRNLTNCIKGDLLTAITRGQNTNWVNFPVGARLFPQCPSPEGTLARTDHKRGSDGGETKESKKKSKSNKQEETRPAATATATVSAAALEEGKKKGFLKVVTPKRQPPLCPCKAVNPKTGKLERYCSWFMYKGYACNFGDKCVRIHPKGANAIPADSKVEFTEWVNKEENTAWDAPQGRNAAA